MKLPTTAVILAFPFAGWALCFATIGIGMAILEKQTALVVHAILAPVYFAILSFLYFRRFNYTKPLQTALIFLVFVMAMDTFVVSLLILRSTEMITSILGAWIPFFLIFASTFLTGLYMERSKHSHQSVSVRP